MMRGRSIAYPARRQRGVAIVAALLLTTLAVSAVSGLFWLQQVQVRAMENQRLHVQTQWVLRAGLDWMQLILRQDGENYPDFTTLAGGWNTPLGEIALDQYVGRDRAAADDSADTEATQASIASRIVDAQSRYNLANLASARALNLPEIGVYERLLATLRLDPSLALRTAQTIAAAQTGETPTARQAALNRVDELQAIPGYTPQVLAVLSDYVVLLPEPTDVNLDTAPPEVLAAVLGGSLADARQLAARRGQAYFRSMDEFTAALHGRQASTGVRVGLKSDYFLVQSRVRQDRAALDALSLIHRQRGIPATTALVWTRLD